MKIKFKNKNIRYNIIKYILHHDNERSLFLLFVASLVTYGISLIKPTLWNSLNGTIFENILTSQIFIQSVNNVSMALFSAYIVYFLSVVQPRSRDFFVAEKIYTISINKIKEILTTATGLEASSSYNREILNTCYRQHIENKMNTEVSFVIEEMQCFFSNTPDYIKYSYTRNVSYGKDDYLGPTPLQRLEVAECNLNALMIFNHNFSAQKLEYITLLHRNVNKIIKLISVDDSKSTLTYEHFMILNYAFKLWHEANSIKLK